MMTARILPFIFFCLINLSYAQTQTEDLTDSTTIENIDTIQETSENTETTQEASQDVVTQINTKESTVENPSFHQILKTKFIEGGAGFMGIVLLTLILGLALCIERILYLHAAGATNNEELLQSIESALKKDGIDKAKEICRNTRGPVASIFYQGLERSSQGIDAVEKSIVSYGSVQMGLLERGTTWISLFIALAPMLGFMGTVIGMIGAFDAIEAAGDISPSLVAGGIKVALLTTVFGLIVAIILQVFYNYIVSKIDDIVNKMEDASIALVDILAKNK
jgi:biopolymer transport protein ExbB